MSTSDKSFVITGGAQGVGQAIALHLARSGFVVIIDTSTTPSWIAANPNIHYLRGDASDSTIAVQAAQFAESRAPLVGWVNNAAVFRDAQLHTASADDVLGLITLNLSLSLVGCHAAIKHFLDQKRSGAIVNVSSHQAQRPVRGALPYAVAKAALEGLTRAAAVDYGQYGIRVNAIALGSIDTERYQEMRQVRPEVDAEMGKIHPLGRVGKCEEVARVVGVLLGDECSFVSGAVVPVDGGRSVQGIDPEGI